MFCFNCGVSLADEARFCSSCGTSLTSAASASAAAPSASSQLPTPSSPPPSYASPPSSQAPPPQSGYFSNQSGYAAPQSSYVSPQPNYVGPGANYNSPPISPSSALLDHTGYPQPAFEHLAAAIFNALDQNVQPQRTGGLEVSKMKAYKTYGSETIPPYYAEHVLPTYAATVGIELVPNRPRGAPVLTRNGWRQFLLQKIKATPDTTFLSLTRVLARLQIPIALGRADFPSIPSIDAQAKDAQFKTQIYALAQQAGTMGAMGGGYGRVGRSNGPTPAVQMTKLAGRTGLGLLNAFGGFGGVGSGGF